MSVYGGDLNKLFESINQAKEDIVQAANSSHATEEERAAQAQAEEDEELDPVQQALAKLDKDRMEREKILARADQEKAKSEEQQKKSAEEAKQDQQRVAEAGANAAKEMKSNLINDARARREQAKKRIALAQARKEAENKRFQQDVDEYVQAQLRARQADEQKVAAENATQAARQALAASQEDEKHKREIADKAKAAVKEANDKQQDRKRRIEELEQEIARLESEGEDESASQPEPKSEEPAPEPVVNGGRNRQRRRDRARIRMTDMNAEPHEETDMKPHEGTDVEPVENYTKEPAQPPVQKAIEHPKAPDVASVHQEHSVQEAPESGDDGLEILEVLPSSLPVTYTGYTPVSDKQNSFASAMQPINSFDATIYLGVKYERFSHRGAFSYYIVTSDKEKNLLHGETGYTDDAYEYAFLGTLLMLQDVVKNKIRQVLIVVQDETIRDILTQNAMNVRDNFSETRSNYVDFMRVNTGVKFVANFAVLPAGSKGNHARHLSVVTSLANSMVKD